MVRLGQLPLDGTKIAADASWSANRTADQLDTAIGELEAWLGAKVEAMLAEAKAADAAEDAEDAEDAALGPERRGEELPVSLRRKAARLARLKEGKRQLDVVLADAGYASEKAFQAADDEGLRLIAPWHKNIDPRTLDPSRDPIDPDKYPTSDRARKRLTTPQGRAHYRQRGRTVEPVFGQIKTVQGLTRFARRGFQAARGEWLLSCAVHNLRKYMNHHTAPATRPA